MTPSSGRGFHINPPRLDVVVLIVVTVVLIVFAVWVSFPKDKNTHSATSQSTDRPTISAPVQTTPPDDQQEDYGGLNRDISKLEQPKEAQAWLFLLAVNTPEDNERLALMKKVATQQFIVNDYVKNMNNVHGLVATINRNVSTFTFECDSLSGSCVMTANYSVVMTRDGKTVNTIGPLQSKSLWINFKDGWRVASLME